MTTPHDYVERLAALAQSGQPFVSVTMVDAVGSTPQDAGSKMLVTAAGIDFGTVGGGRVEHRAIEHAQKMLRRQSGAAARELVEWNLQRDVGMTCGGVVRLYFETYNHRIWNIAICGAGHVANALVRTLLSVDCRLTCIDPREDWLAKLPASSRLQTVCTDSPAGTLAAIPEGAFVLLMTMGHRTDRPLLEQIFRTGRRFPFVGVIGSRSKRKVLERELVAAGIDAHQATQFVCPLGLDLGTNHPGEISISIAAQLLQHRDEVVTQEAT